MLLLFQKRQQILNAFWVKCCWAALQKLPVGQSISEVTARNHRLCSRNSAVASRTNSVIFDQKLDNSICDKNKQRNLVGSFTCLEFDGRIDHI